MNLAQRQKCRAAGDSVSTVPELFQKHSRTVPEWMVLYHIIRISPHLYVSHNPSSQTGPKGLNKLEIMNKDI